MFALFFIFVCKDQVTKKQGGISRWRSRHQEETLIKVTASNFFSFSIKVAEVHVSHDTKQLGGKGKTIEFDESFLTRQKYKRSTLENKFFNLIFRFLYKSLSFFLCIEKFSLLVLFRKINMK